MDIDIDQHLCWWGRGRRSRLSGSGRSDDERTPRAAPESGGGCPGAEIAGRRSPPAAGSAAVELPEALGDPGDELGVALAPVAGVAHHLVERVLAHARGAAAAIEQLRLAGAHHLVEGQHPVVAAGERLVDARLELALGPGADLARDALPVLGPAEVALQAIDLPLALELRRHL